MKPRGKSNTQSTSSPFVAGAGVPTSFVDKAGQIASLKRQKSSTNNTSGFVPSFS